MTAGFCAVAGRIDAPYESPRRNSVFAGATFVAAEASSPTRSPRLSTTSTLAALVPADSFPAIGARPNSEVAPAPV